MNRMRSDVARAYSALSKGIHHEYVIPPEKLYDREAVAACLSDAMKLSAHLALIVQMVPHCCYPIKREEAFQCYGRLQSIEVK